MNLQANRIILCNEKPLGAKAASQGPHLIADRVLIKTKPQRLELGRRVNNSGKLPL